MSKKVLPTKVTIGQIVNLACEFGLPKIGILPKFSENAVLTLTKKTAGEFLTGAVKELVGEETFAEHTQEMESPASYNLRQQIELANQVLNGILAKHTGDKFDYRAFLAESGPVSQQIVKMEEEISKLGSVESVVLAKAVDVFGETVFDYKEDVLIWRQQVAATKEKFGVEYLVLFPINSSPAAPFVHSDELKVAVCVEEKASEDQWQWRVVAILPTTRENSTFFKDVAKLVGKDSTTDGVNAVEFYPAGEFKPVVVDKEVIRK